MTSTFRNVMERYPRAWVQQQMATVTPQKVESALRRASHYQRLTPENLIALLSPQAHVYLEDLAQISLQLTQQRFGKIIQMYVPLYLSNECLCNCTYCGFSYNNDIVRKTLNDDEILQEAQFLYDQGFRHILLLSGEDARYVGVPQLQHAVQLIQDKFSSISIEVQPLRTEQYAELVDAGIDGLTVYQETYDRDLYRQIHLSGGKKRFDYRLAAPERGGEAGMRKLGIGALLGLVDWRTEAFYVGLHAQFLERKYWRSHISISFPRIREATGQHGNFLPVSDPDFVQAMTALRAFLPNVGMVLSTRETSEFRDNVFPLCITQMSAGSRTTIGGYFEENDSGAQFELEDHRSPEEVASMIQQTGYDPVWKDWDVAFLQREAV